MTTHKKTTDKIEWEERTLKEIRAVVLSLMNAAQTHKSASVLCRERVLANPFNIIDNHLFSAVSFELILVSVEQSLRLLFLLFFNNFPKNPNHDLYALYKELQDRDTGEESIRRDIIQEINVFGQTQNIRPISEWELVACLEKHRSSYMDFKYFHVDKKGKRNRDNKAFLGFLSKRDQEIFFCLASALICLNTEEIEKRGFGFPVALCLVPESEMTERFKAFTKRAGM